MRFGLLVVLAASVAVAAAKKKQSAPKLPPPLLTEPSARLAEALTEKPTAMLSAATKVMLYRVTSQPGVRPNPQVAIGGEYERLGAGRELSEGEIKRLKGLWYDEKSFKFDRPPACGNFSPELALVGTSEGDTGMLEVLVSFKCSGVMFFTARTAGRSLPGAQLDFKPSRKALLTMLKELLPQDAAVQALK